MKITRMHRRSVIALVLLVVGTLLAYSLMLAQQTSAVPAKVEYKIVSKLGIGNPQSSALDSFTKSKPVSDLDTKLKALGQDGWMLVYFEREEGYAIFARHQP